MKIDNGKEFTESDIAFSKFTFARINLTENRFVKRACAF